MTAEPGLVNVAYSPLLAGVYTRPDKTPGEDYAAAGNPGPTSGARSRRTGDRRHPQPGRARLADGQFVTNDPTRRGFLTQPAPTKSRVSRPRAPQRPTRPARSGSLMNAITLVSLAAYGRQLLGARLAVRSRPAPPAPGGRGSSRRWSPAHDRGRSTRRLAVPANAEIAATPPVADATVKTHTRSIQHNAGVWHGAASDRACTRPRCGHASVSDQRRAQTLPQREPNSRPWPDVQTTART
jgi:hypothetical protein